jgi:hypothetical protein
VYVEGVQRDMEDARPGREVERRDWRIVVMALGVKGGFIRRRESLVVEAFMSDEESCARERGLISLFEVEEVVDCSWVRRVEMLEMVDFRVVRSFSALLVDPGIFAVGDRVPRRAVCEVVVDVTVRGENYFEMRTGP